MKFIDKKIPRAKLCEILAKLLIENDILEEFSKEANIDPKSIYIKNPMYLDSGNEIDYDIINTMELEEQISNNFEIEELLYTIITIYNDYN